MPPKGSNSKKRKGAAALSDAAVAVAAAHGIKLDNGRDGSPASGGGLVTTSTGSLAYPPLKPPDGVALFRKDLQWDHLENIFNSVSFRFTPPSYPDSLTPLFPTDRSWSFAELYLDCLANGQLANKNLKDKMSESTVFAVHFAKLCLLINVGRINTTLAFYPEMRTALRTYHPIPSMQLDDFTKKNLQDAPRMKAQLKGCCLPSEAENPPDSLAEIIRRGTVLGLKPPTSVVICIFLLYNEWLRVTQKYFPEGFNLHDLFYPGDPTNTIPSAQRTQAFLYLVHRFLETPELVARDFSNGEEKLPEDQLLQLERRDCTDENQDTSEELQFASEMQKFREEFMEKFRAEDATNAASQAGDDDATPVPEEKKGKGGRKSKAPRASSSTAAGTSPAKKSRLTQGDTSRATTPLAALPILATALSHDQQTTPLPTVKVEAGLSVDTSSSYPPAPSSIASGVMTPTAIVPQSLVTSAPVALPAGFNYLRELARSKKAVAAVPKLVPAKEGVAEPLLLQQWNHFYETKPSQAKSLLQIAWQKMKRDIEEDRDPVYESEDEVDWSVQELQPRLSGFLFRNHRTDSKDVLRYQGQGPIFPPYGLGSGDRSSPSRESQSAYPHSAADRDRDSAASASPTRTAPNSELDDTLMRQYTSEPDELLEDDELHAANEEDVKAPTAAQGKVNGFEKAAIEADGGKYSDVDMLSPDVIDNEQGEP